MTPPRGRPPGLSGDDLLDIARSVFLENGYPGTTMDEVASRARISKASLYREHPSKSALYAAVVAHWSDSGRDAMRPALERLLAGGDPASDLVDLATVLRRGVLSPSVIGMRRLVTSEAESHPKVARRYLAESWTRNIDDLAQALGRLAATDRLVIDDPKRAAEEFTWLVVGASLNAALLTGSARSAATSPESAIGTFLARYLPKGARSPGRARTAAGDDG